MYEARVQRAVSKQLLPPNVRDLGPSWPVGAPFLVSESDGLPIIDVLRFMRDRYVAGPGSRRQKSPRTIEACAYDLKDYLDYLDAIGLDVLNVQVTDIENYVHSMGLTRSAVTGREFSKKTIARRMSTIRSYYRWAGQRGITKYNIPVDSGALGEHQFLWERPGDQIYDPDVQKPDFKVRTIPADKLKLILDASGFINYNVDDPNFVEAPKLRLMFECALQAGLRRFEIPLITVRELKKSLKRVVSNNPLSKVRIDIFGKGGRFREVMVPLWLINNLSRYLEGQRALAINQRRSIDENFIDHGYLFVRDDHRRLIGNRLSIRYLSDPMRKIQQALGIHAGEMETHDPYDRYYGVHALRHTYAVNEYLARKQMGDPEPWHYVQAQLGHRFLQTTISIYLAIAAEYEQEFAQILRRSVENLRDGNG